ncbi:MAG TPA: recombinase family protein, partial [Acetobacteraceae bacterium]|nr:recombinase family protein [Acetobacteraceae bacterium]
MPEAMMTGKPQAYSYLRFSTAEQMKGDSFRRQTAMAEEYARRHGLELDQDLTFNDLGVSAFRGRNTEAGRLGDFLAAVNAGLVPPGSYLLVESLDRISRQFARKALRTLEDIVEQGVTVVTLNDGRAHTADILDNDPTALLLALLTFIRANEESATKARRLRAAWQGKRLKAAAGIGMTAKCPAWLRLDPDTRRYEPLPEHAEVVRRIFALASQGVGLHGVAATLNRDGVPTFGSGPKKAEFWNRSYIAKIVDSPAVIGTYVPHSVDHDAGRRKRVPGEPIEGYFPAVVDPEVHARVQASRLGRRAPATRSGHAQSVSLLAGLAVCPWCGATMTRVVKGKKGGKPRLTCVRSKLGACRMPSVPQHEAEDTLIYWAGTLSRVPSGGSDWDEAHMELVQKIGGYDRQIQTVAD